MPEDERANSMCAVYADLIETQLDSDDPDMESIRQKLDYIRKYCQTVAYAPGESPEHLEEHQFEEGDDVPTPTAGGSPRE